VSDQALPKARVPLRLKLASLATFLAVVPLLGVGIGLIGINVVTVQQLSREIQILALEDLARTIDEQSAAATDSLDTVAALFTNQSLDDETRINVIQGIVQGDALLDHAALYGADGAQLIVIEEENGHAQVPQTLPAELRARLERQHSATGDVFRQGPETRALFAVRIRVGDRTTGYVASSITLDPIQERVERLSVGHFSGLEEPLYVVDRQFRVIASTDRERAVALTPAHDQPLLRGLSPEMLNDTLGSSSEFRTHDGEPMLGSIAGMHSQPWALVAQVPRDVAYASLYRMTYIVAGTVLAAIILALLLGLFFAGRIASPLRQLTEYARLLATRNFSARVDVKTRDELSVLAHSMNTAAADLQASEERIKTEVAIRTDLGRYIPAELVEQIVRRERDMALGGTRRSITVMFADVVGFTPLTEQLAPEHVVTILNELFTILTGIVFRHGGTVDKFVGDCVMAMWGAPSDQPDHARRALEAAEDMMSWLETGNARWQQRYGIAIQLAIGIHTGEAVVGNIGSEQRMEYTAIGDVVNVAARLEGIARPQQILVTDQVKRAAGEQFEYVDADLHRLSGRAEPIHLWEVRA
jgi:adenylate cyclase